MRAPIAIPMEDENVHTDYRPFCGDMTCPCHMNHELYVEMIRNPLERGELTDDEASRFFWGEQLGGCDE